jgi:hypothetical protein
MCQGLKRKAAHTRAHCSAPQSNNVIGSSQSPVGIHNRNRKLPPLLKYFVNIVISHHYIPLGGQY